MEEDEEKSDDSSDYHGSGVDGGFTVKKGMSVYE